jgi:hypothetical protein
VEVGRDVGVGFGEVLAPIVGLAAVVGLGLAPTPKRQPTSRVATKTMRAKPKTLDDRVAFMIQGRLYASAGSGADVAILRTWPFGAFSV